MDLENGLEGYRHQKTRGCRENSEVIYNITIPGGWGQGSHVNVKFVKTCLCDQRQISFWSEMSLCLPCLLSICAHLPELSLCPSVCGPCMALCFSASDCLPIALYTSEYVTFAGSSTHLKLNCAMIFQDFKCS